MKNLSDEVQVDRFETALNHLIERVSEDRYVLAVVLVGSLSKETIWRRESISLWIIEADGVCLRLRSDGNDERIYRTLVEDGINIHAQVIPRSRFKMMGGELIASGTPEEIAECKKSHTGRFLAEYL